MRYALLFALVLILSAALLGCTGETNVVGDARRAPRVTTQVVTATPISFSNSSNETNVSHIVR